VDAVRRGPAYGGAVGAEVVPGGPDPDPVEVGRLYVQENRTETEIAAHAVRQPSPGNRGPAGCRDPTAGLPQGLPGRPRHSSRVGPGWRDGDRGGPGARVRCECGRSRLTCLTHCLQ
jgi:hypothetical protein